MANVNGKKYQFDEAARSFGNASNPKSLHYFEFIRENPANNRNQHSFVVPWQMTKEGETQDQKMFRNSRKVLMAAKQ